MTYLLAELVFLQLYYIYKHWIALWHFEGYNSRVAVLFSSSSN